MRSMLGSSNHLIQSDGSEVKSRIVHSEYQVYVWNDAVRHPPLKSFIPFSQKSSKYCPVQIRLETRTAAHPLLLPSMCYEEFETFLQPVLPPSRLPAVVSWAKNLFGW